MATTVTLKPNAIDISGSTSGTTTLQATAVAGTTTLTLPAATDTLVGKATTDTLTNKTLTGAVMNGTLGATTPSTVAATTISASSTATFAAGAVGTPSITTTGDTNTGIWFPAADTIAFTEGGVESMRIDSSGNVGIGVAPTAALGALQVATGTNGTAAKLGNGAFVQSFNGDGIYSGSASLDSAGVWTARSTGASIVGATIASGLLFYTNSGLTNGSTFSPTERMRIDTSGNLMVGTTNSAPGNGSGNNVAGFAANSNGTTWASRSGFSALSVNRVDTTGEVVRTASAGTQVGNISVTASATAYNTSSDYRLKNITGSLTGAKDFIMALQPKQGTWKVDGSKFVGFLAHEFQEVSPTSVSGIKDAVDADGKPIIQTMQASSSEVIANLVAHIQNLEIRLSALETN